VLAGVGQGDGVLAVQVGWRGHPDGFDLRVGAEALQAAEGAAAVLLAEGAQGMLAQVHGGAELHTRDGGEAGQDHAARHAEANYARL
jgi:hypothetical protein